MSSTTKGAVTVGKSLPAARNPPPLWRRIFLLSKASLRLWLAGVQEALQLQRCVLFFFESREILEKTALCFTLNVCLFVGSIAFLHYVLQPATQALLRLGFQGATSQPDDSSSVLSAWYADERVGALIGGLPTMLFNALWLFPMYILSCLVNSIWYSDIAKMAVAVRRERIRKQIIIDGKADKTTAALSSSSSSAAAAPHSAGLPQFLAQEICKLLLFALFFAQVTLLGVLPYVGPPLYFAYYKWDLDGTALSQRVAVMESNAAFFMGFGAPCVLFSLLLPFYTGIGVVNFLYPLFVLIACDTDIKTATAKGRQMAPMFRLPLFRAAQWQSDVLIRHCSPFGRTGPKSA
eukprot:CAMPEP_0177755198 /NCGR_PEP_ID=MMETSP0491_2-20121128/2434_1 /TAXON_ID=63592 /ORGANISM="Tetraselmis chuii, Strain PLY429" /LENGTH=348 /DNA_ID=CAMNT_0019270671 /DNA_START=213 /DNA_END=1260 /DNA_ORIENTATION=-